MLTNLLLTAVLLILLLFLGLAFALLVYFQRLRRRFVAFVTAPDEKTPSEFAEIVGTIGHTLGHAAAVEIKTTIMGKISGESRLGEAIAKQVVQSSQPGLAGLVEAIPRNARRKNAGIFEFLVDRFGPALLPNLTGPPGGGQGGNHTNDTSGASPKFKL